jgi:hypothetical protein
MSQTGPHQAYEYLREAIVSARSREELNDLERLAQAHFDGRRFKDLEAEIAASREALDRVMRADRRKPSPNTQGDSRRPTTEKREDPDDNA